VLYGGGERGQGKGTSPSLLVGKETNHAPHRLIIKGGRWEYTLRVDRSCLPKGGKELSGIVTRIKGKEGFPKKES